MYVTEADTSPEKSVKEDQPSAHSVDDMDFMEAGNVQVAHGPFAAHIDKSDISVRQVLSRANHLPMAQRQCKRKTYNKSYFCSSLRCNVWAVMDKS